MTRFWMRFFFVMWAAVLAIGTVAFSEPTARIMVRGQEIPVADLRTSNGTPYLLSSDRSLNQAARLLGGSLVYDSDRQQILVSVGGHAYVLSRSGLRVDGTDIPLPAPSMLMEGESVFFSLGAVAKALGASLVYDPEKNIWYLDPMISQVALQAQESGFTVTVRATGPVAPGVMRLANPERVAVDFPFSALSPLFHQPEMVPNVFVEGIHVAQHQSKPNIVRVVMILARPDVSWTTQAAPDGREFSLSVATAVVPQFQLPSLTPQNPSGPPSTLTSLEIKNEEKNGETSLVADFKVLGSTPYEWHRLKPPDNRIFMDLVNCVQGIDKSPAYNSPLVNDIRIRQFQTEPFPIVRIAMDVSDAYETRVESTPEGFRITVTSKTSQNPELLAGSGTTGTQAPSVATSQPPKSGKTRVPRNGVVIVLDPGHGGSDPGAHGQYLVEKDLTLDIALRLRDLLDEEGFRVILTRSSDRDVLWAGASSKAELQARVDVANRARAALFISLHINSAPGSWPHGVQTHWYKAVDLPLASVIQRSLGSRSALVNRGILRDRFYVLRHSRVPSVLVEMGFLSNREDESLLSKPEIRQTLAEALRDGIREFAGQRINARL